MGTTAPGRALVALGLTASMSQAVLLREGMAALGGSELSWGTVLATWLLGMAVGARLGAGRGGARLAWIAPFALPLVAASGVVLLRALPALSGGVTGELPATVRGAWVWVLSVFPSALVGGWAFAVLAGRLTGDGAAGRAYGLEAAGGLAGGLAFSFVFASHASSVILAAAMGVALLTVARPRRRAFAATVALTLVGLTALGSTVLARASWRWSGRPGSLAAWKETRQERLELSAGSPASLYGDGTLLATFPDPIRTIPEGHLLALLHPHPHRVLCVGCMVAGVVPTLRRYPLDRLDLVEDDPQLAALVPGWFGAPLRAALADPRVRILAQDPLRAVEAGQGWDEIILLDGNPTTVRRNRTRTEGFFRSCAARLTPGGVVVVRVGVPDTYLGGAGGRLLAVLAASLRTCFAEIRAVPGDEILLVAGPRSAGITLDPAVLSRRWDELGRPDPAFDPALLRLLLDPERAETLHRALAQSGPLNRAARPRAVLLAAALEEGRVGHALVTAARLVGRTPVWWFAAAVGAAVAALLACGRVAGPPAIGIGAVVGFASMGWWLLLLAAWQATLGSVYSEVGALSGTFMAGTALGALALRRRHSCRWLAAVLAAGAGLSAVIASGLPMSWPRLTVVPLLVAGGLLTGAAFPGVAALAGGGRSRRGAGRGFAADELGAAAAALVVGIAALPWVGAAGVGWALAALCLGAAAAARFGERAGASAGGEER